jgi:glycosyltransferase involved in cell wall biosynthesis
MTRPIRVLWVVKGLGPGGAERLLVEHAAAGDHDTFAYEAAFVLSWKDHLVNELAARDVVAHSLGVRSVLDPRWVHRLHRLLTRERFDIVHVHSPQVAVVVRSLVRSQARRHRPALVYTEHNRWPSYRIVTRVANRLTFRWNDAVIAVSDDVRESVSAPARQRVEVVVHGIDVARVRAHLRHRDAVRAELGAGPEQVLAVTVANLRPGKNYPGLLAAARLVIDHGAPVWFVAAGQGQLENEIRAQHAHLGLGERFRLLGYVEDASRVIAAADIFVLASHHEGLPVAAMEALALGVPVVAPAVGGLRQAVGATSGVLVEPGRPDALATAIERLCDADVRARLASGAREQGDRFSSARAVARIDDLYRTLRAARAAA